MHIAHGRVVNAGPSRIACQCELDQKSMFDIALSPAGGSFCCVPSYIFLYIFFILFSRVHSLTHSFTSTLCLAHSAFNSSFFTVLTLASSSSKADMSCLDILPSPPVARDGYSCSLSSSRVSLSLSRWTRGKGYERCPPGEEIVLGNAMLLVTYTYIDTSHT